MPRSQWSTLAEGRRLALTGDHHFRLPFGEIYSANLTPDPVTGIGTRSDRELARILRYGVRADNRAVFPLMEIRLTDDDLVAVISYLRSQAAVSHPLPEHKLSRFGKALMAFAISPQAAAKAPPAVSPGGASIERGANLARRIVGAKREVECAPVVANQDFGALRRFDVVPSFQRIDDGDRI